MRSLLSCGFFKNGIIRSSLHYAARVLVVACALYGMTAVRAQSIYEPYHIATFAGNAHGGDGTINEARFYIPAGMALDSAGNIYVADTYNHAIRKITPSGVVTTLAGSCDAIGSADGTGSEARFYYPSGVAADSAGNVYVADTQNNTIRKITPAGVVTTLAGSPEAGGWGEADGTGSAAQFRRPCGVAVDSAGNVYVADTQNYTIRKITPAGVVTTLAGSPVVAGSADGTGSAARFYVPQSLAVDSAGNLYVTDTGNSTIRKITSAGVVTTLAGSPGVAGSADGNVGEARFAYPSGVALDNVGNIYVADTNSSTIRKITSAGVVTTLAGSPGVIGSADGTGSAARFNRPIGLVADSAGSVYVADTYNSVIRKITPANVVTTWASTTSGSRDGTGRAARFASPFGVAVDSAGNVYVADAHNYTIRKITFAGEVTTLAGSPLVSGSADGTGSAARFHSPFGVAVDSGGNVFVADMINCTIRKITPAGEVTTLAGSPLVYGSADGTGSAARFNEPYGVAVDSAGYVYVGDRENDTVRKITPGGVVTTLAGSPGVIGSTDGTGSAARFNTLSGVAVDSAGYLYVADTFNHTIRKITPAGVVTTLAGSPGVTGSTDGTGSAARFNLPYGVAVDNAGNVYVADTNNKTIRKITSAGVVTTLAGDPRANGGIADGAGSAARFNSPFGVAVDSAGEIFVGDWSSSTVRIGGPSIQLVAAVSRKMHGALGPFDVSLPLTGQPGVECRSSSGNHTFVFTFNNNLTSGAASWTNGAGSINRSPTISGQTMTVHLTGVFDVQRITVTLSGMTDRFSPTLPDTAVSMNMLIGDTTGNKTVNASDLAQTKSQSGAAVTTANFREDVTADGAIDSADVMLVKSRSGSGISAFSQQNSLTSPAGR